MKELPVIIIGNGGHAKVLVDILLSQKRHIIGFTTPSKEDNPYDIPYIGNDEAIISYSPEEVELVNALGSTRNMTARKRVYNFFRLEGYTFTRVISPNSIISKHVDLGEGVQIMAGAVVQPFVNIADNTIINTAVSIDHDCIVGQHCHIAPGTTMSGAVTVGDSTHIGTGTTIIQNVDIGSNVLVGAGSVVLNDIKNGRKAYGVPAKEV